MAMFQPDQLLLNLKEVRLRPVQQEQLAGLIGGDLAAKFAPDAAAGARHKHHAILKSQPDALRFQFDALAP